MIAKLRKRHKVIWIVIGVVLPLSFIAITQTLPEDGFSPSEQKSEDGQIEMTASKTDKKVQIEIKQKIRCAFCTLYGDAVTSANFLGNVTSSGIYEYQPSNASELQRIILFDEIKKKELYTIDL